MLSSLGIVLTLLGGGFYGFKKWPGSKKLTGRSKMIEVLSQHHLGPKRSLAVVRVAGESCLIGVTDQNITILKTLSLLDDDIPAQKNQNSDQNVSDKFQKALAATFSNSDKSQDKAAYYTRTAKVDKQPAPEKETEEFTMQGLREIVGEKLRTMREL